jgi:hypothetical protein
MDTYQSVKLLGSLDLAVLEESLQIFRDNLFQSQGRKKTPQLIASLLESSESHFLLSTYDGNTI